jgi:two-component system phosphate regulon sensor histidine kinase PhoR
LRYSSTTHKVIAIFSFLILSSVQFFLLYNTYELKNDHFYLEERSILSTEYSIAIRNDKVMPGGQRIIDSFLVPNTHLLENLYNTDRPAFDLLKQKICDSIFATLRKANTADTVLARIIRGHKLNHDLEYVLLIDDISIMFGDLKYVNLYNRDHRYPLIDPSIQTKDGVCIGGSLQEPLPRNQVVGVAVFNSLAYSNRVGFSLHVDIRNRRATILRLMMPTFLLALFSILSVVFLFFITFRNWQRQKKLSEMKSDFINSITHEFHTPLTAIIVANKTMQKEKIISSPENLQPLIEVVQRQSLRLQTLISQVLDITTLNKISLNKEEYSIHHLLDEILLDYRLKLSGTNIMFTLQKDAERDIVLLDRFWFTTILQNIFDNAIKYNNKEQKEITVSTFDDKKAVHVSIRDNGIGMTEDIKKQVFDKFYRFAGPENATVKGLGLGLFYVKQAVDAHSWSIDIVSGEGQGSTFIISIPF